MLGRMDRMVLAEVVPWFVGSVFLFTSLFFAAGEMMRVAEYLGMGVAPSVVGRMFLLTLPYIVGLTFPMAMLLAALLGFGRLSNDSEIVALVAGGASFQRIVVPLAAFALGVSLVGLWFADAVIPAANRGREAIINEVKRGIGVSGSATAFTIPVREDGRLTALVHVEGGADWSRNTLRNVGIELWRGGRMVGGVSAERAVWVVGTRNWEFEQGYLLLRNENGDFTGGSLGGLKTQENALFQGGRILALGTPEELLAVQGPVKEAPILELRRRIALYRANRSEAEAREAEVEIAQRLALPFASFIFALVGAPLGVRPQRAGKGVGFGLAVFIIFAYWIVFQLLSYLGRAGVLPPMVAVAVPNVIGIAAALFLIRRVLR